MLAVVGAEKIRKRVVGLGLGVGFVIISIWSYKNESGWIGFGMGLLACAAVFMMNAECNENRTLNWFAKYTMPIFLMHTLFAAPTRVVLAGAKSRMALDTWSMAMEVLWMEAAAQSRSCLA